jgi:fumarylacetoacetase
MTALVDNTHDADVQSWVASANSASADFPLQNLPYGRFKREAAGPFAIGVAIGDQVLDLRAAGLIDHADMHRLMAEPRAALQALRMALFDGLREGSAAQAKFSAALVPQADVTMGLPCEIRDYTDFYTSIHHATTVGKQFRPDAPLLPNYKWVPIGYHGRASSIGVSGQAFPRPLGQTRSADADMPSFGPCRRLDYELELGVFVGRPNPLGTRVPITEAEDHVFGIALFNDWSARDIQAWEYQPLGPFLSKNFASTVSPWVVTLDALAPFRKPWTRPAGDPEPLAYLDAPANRAAGSFDIQLEVWLQTPAMQQAGSPGERLMTANYADAYWTVAQLITHHTVNGCNLRTGDLLGTGTLSGPAAEQGGSLLELSQGGKRPINLANGESRTWLEDGDTVVLKAYCMRDGARRIGFGECRGTVLPANS